MCSLYCICNLQSLYTKERHLDASAKYNFTILQGCLIINILASEVES